MALIDKNGYMDIQGIKSFIANQFAEILEENEDYFRDLDISLTDTRQFVTIKDRKPGRIYLVISFGAATLNYKQYTLPITIEAISEQNSLEICQRLLFLYAQKYNLFSTNDETIQEFISSPETSSLFEEVYAGFRATYNVSGSLLISKETNPVKIEYKDENSEEFELIDIIEFNGDLNITVDPKIPYGNDNFSRSIGRYGTQSVNFVMYLGENNLSYKLIKIFLRMKDIEKKKGKDIPIVDYPFTLKISFPKIKDELGRPATMIQEFKLTNLGVSKSIGAYTMANVSFTC